MAETRHGYGGAGGRLTSPHRLPASVSPQAGGHEGAFPSYAFPGLTSLPVAQWYFYDPHVHEDKPTASGCFYPHWGIFVYPRKKVKEYAVLRFR